MFDTYMVEHALVLEAVLIGGAALALLGVIARETLDCDLIEPELPEQIREGARAFALSIEGQGGALRDDWLNNGPAQLGQILPAGWRLRLQLVYRGRALILWSPSRADLLLTKLFALCDRGLDLNDCQALKPTSKELEGACAWLVQQDQHPDWPDHVRATLADLGRRCGHGL